jgi:ABC-type sulfate transport system substrate-binding protein
MRQKDEHLYLHNRLTLMVPRGNPAKITSVNDLARGDVRISQPDPENEDIAYHIMDMYRRTKNLRKIRIPAAIALSVAG